MAIQKHTAQAKRLSETMADTEPDEAQEQSTTPPLAVDGADRLETEFLATISHELRSPLAAIKGYAATLRRHGHKLGRAERDEFLRAIDEASDRMELLISRLMELARLEAGALTPTLVPVDVARLVNEALIAAEHRWNGAAAEESVYTFVAPTQESLPLALADLRLQREALDIVLENAVKYSPGGGAILVTLNADDTQITIGVHDRGAGIAPEHLRHIFDRFYRVDTRLTREVEGAGIGLAMCQRIMELQGGAIWVESEPGVGSDFYLSLPLAREPAGAARPETPHMTLKG